MKVITIFWVDGLDDLNLFYDRLQDFLKTQTHEVRVKRISSTKKVRLFVVADAADISRVYHWLAKILRKGHKLKIYLKKAPREYCETQDVHLTSGQCLVNMAKE